MNSVLERAYYVCNNVRVNNSQPITFKKLVSQLRKEFAKHNFDILVTIKKDKKVLAESEFYVMAYYDHEADLENETSIEIVIHHNFIQNEQFGQTQMTEFLTEIFDATVHEHKHQQQSRRRQYVTYGEHTTSPYSKYLSDPDELDAYAVSIAIELLRSLGYQKSITYMTKITVLSKRRNGFRFTSPNLNAYIKCFGFDFLVKRLAKKIYKHLETLDKRYIFV